MSRYIDADALLAKQQPIELPHPYGGKYHIDIVHACDVRNAPTADVVEVVRCKDCKHYRAYEPPIEDFDGWCSVNENKYDKEFYCQYGERSEGCTT